MPEMDIMNSVVSHMKDCIGYMNDKTVASIVEAAVFSGSNVGIPAPMVSSTSLWNEMIYGSHFSDQNSRVHNVILVPSKMGEMCTEQVRDPT